jgi:hypothetical protein
VSKYLGTNEFCILFVVDVQLSADVFQRNFRIGHVDFSQACLDHIMSQPNETAKTQLNRYEQNRKAR